MTTPAENQGSAPETAVPSATATPSDRILFAITAAQFIAEYEELAYFRRQDEPNHSPEYWPPWAALTPELQESLLRQAAVLLEKRLQNHRWLQLEDLVYTLVDPAISATAPAPSPETLLTRAAAAEPPAATPTNPPPPQGK